MSGERRRTVGSIYALTTPPGTPFYVGATMQRPRERAMQHLRDAAAGRKSSPLHELLAETGRCGFWILEAGVEPEQLGARERHHKFALERAGFPMLNYHHGNNGCNRQPPAIRAAISRHAARRPRDDRGHFIPQLPAIAGAAPSPGELFMGAGEL
jgi:hypothetical protein